MRMILFCLGQRLPRPAHISAPSHISAPPLRTDNTHPGHYLTSKPHSALHTRRKKRQQSASSLCCVQVLFALYTVLIISCAIVCAIVVLPPMSGVIQCAVCIIQCAMCIIQDGQHPPQSFSVLGASVLRWQASIFSGAAFIHLPLSWNVFSIAWIFWAIAYHE